MNQPTNGGVNRAPRKKKKKRSFAAVIITIILVAVLGLAGLIAIVYASGVRYIKVNGVTLKIAAERVHLYIFGKLGFIRGVFATYITFTTK